MSVLTDETYWLIKFEDASMGIEIFTNESCARARVEQLSLTWNCHLFVQAKIIDHLRQERDEQGVFEQRGYVKGLADGRQERADAVQSAVAAALEQAATHIMVGKVRACSGCSCGWSADSKTTIYRDENGKETREMLSGSFEKQWAEHLRSLAGSPATAALQAHVQAKVDEATADLRRDLATSMHGEWPSIAERDELRQQLAAAEAHEKLAVQENTRWLLSSLVTCIDGYPNAGGDISVMEAVERLVERETKLAVQAAEEAGAKAVIGSLQCPEGMQKCDSLLDRQREIWSKARSKGALARYMQLAVAEARGDKC